MSRTEAINIRTFQPRWSLQLFLKAIFIISPGLLFIGAWLLFSNVLQMLSVIVFPFSKSLFRRINRNICGVWWIGLTLFIEKVCGVEIVLTGDGIPFGENALLISNHQSMADIPVIMSLGLRKWRLGDLKWFSKRELQWIPGIGWGLKFLGSPFLSRTWDQDIFTIQKTFRAILEESLPFWLASFPEGTRITQDKWEKTKKYCEKSGVKPLKNLLLPRTKGFVASLKGLRPKAHAVYDFNLYYPEGVPSLGMLFVGRYGRVLVHVERIPVEKIPLDDSAVAAWLHLRFRRKDEWLEKIQSKWSSF